MRSPILILGLLAVGLGSTALAQNTFGVRLGVNAATLTGDFASSSGAEQRIGFAAGIYGVLPLQYGLMLQPEILYTQKGFRPVEPDSVANAEPVVELTYIEIPILVKYPVFMGSLRVDPYAGPFASFELAERLRIGEASDGTSEQIDDIASPDIGFVMGGDLNFALGTLEVVLGGRYTRGVKNLLEPSVATEGRSSSVFTSTFSFFVGLNL